MQSTKEKEIIGRGRKRATRTSKTSCGRTSFKTNDRNEKTVKRRDDLRCYSFPHVNGALQNQTYAQQISSFDPGQTKEVIMQMFKMLQKHNEFVDREWTKKSKLSEVTRFIQDEFTRLIGKDHTIFLFYSEEDGAQYYWIKTVEESEEYGNIIPFQWIAPIRRRNRKLYKLTQQFLHLFHTKFHMPAWNDYNCNYWIDELEVMCTHDFESFEDEVEDPEGWREDFKYWKREIGFLHNCIHQKVTIKEFEENLKDYKPHMAQYKGIHKWFVDSLEFLKSGLTFHHFESGPLLMDSPTSYPYFNNGEIWPSSYVGFTLVEDDNIGHHIMTCMSEAAGNGLIPIMEHELITKSNIKKGPKFGMATEFYHWMSQGNDAARDLIFTQSKYY